MMSSDLAQVPDHQPAGQAAGDQVPASAVSPQDLSPNRPVRWPVVVAEVLAAGVLALLAAWAWRWASIPVRLPETDNPAIPETVSRLSGPRAVAAIAAATVAGLLVLDAVRRVAIGIRVERHPSVHEVEDSPAHDEAREDVTS